ncbi:MAG TPA: PAS domain-containing protein [Anaerolineae bacterium]|nr:PAS domain-containing protein [Anaerolineae bacterium]HPL27796.1 PAS domain-containing protein [Anaerolineae bacterium]
MPSPAPAMESIQHLAAILDSITDAVIVLDRAGTVTYVNAAAERLSQRPREALIGRPTWEAFAESFTPDLLQQYAQAAEQRVPMALEAYYPPRGMWFEVHVSPWSDGLALLCTDITARKRAEQERAEALAREQQARAEAERAAQRIVTILESITDAFFALDAQGRFTYVNRKATEIWRLDRDQIIGRSVWEVFPEFVGSQMQQAYEEIMARRQAFATEFYYQPTDTWVSLRAYPADSGAAGYFEDITARKRAEGERARLLGQVAQQKATLQAIVDNVHACITVFRGHDLVVELTNPTSEATLPGKLVPGKPLRESWPEIPSRLEALLRQVFETGESHGVEDMPLTVRRGPGAPPEEIYVTFSFARLPSGAGGQAAVLGTGYDTTRWMLARQRMEALAAETQLRAAEVGTILASVPDGIVVFGRDAKVLRANPAAVAGIGMEPRRQEGGYEQRIAAMRLTTEGGQPFPMEEHPVTRALRGETTRSVVMALDRPGVPRFWLSVSAAPIRAPDGSILGAVAAMSDITAQHELREKHEDTLRAVSHDLRNPLAGILGQAQLCERRLAKAGLERERASAETIATTAQRMNTMIQDLVDVARSETGQLKLERRPLDLRTFALDLLARLATTLETGRIQVHIPATLPPVSADPARLERILTNLWSNALKYSAPGTPVTVSARQEGREVITSVADRGPGIAPEDLPGLFQRYFRTAAAEERRKGVGLGLYITRRLVEAHDGRIWAESTVGVGSVFSFSLPIAEAERTA